MFSLFTLFHIIKIIIVVEWPWNVTQAKSFNAYNESFFISENNSSFDLGCSFELDM